MKLFRITISAAVLLLMTAAALSADALWTKADQIADASGSLVPGIREVVYAETDDAGMPVLEKQALYMHGETQFGRISVRYFGDESLNALIGSYTDGIPFTPFTSGAELIAYGAVGVFESVNGEPCTVYSFELTVDRDTYFYHTPGQVSGVDLYIYGNVWISTATGAPVKVQNISSVGFTTFEQNVFYSWDGSTLLPVSTVTYGSKERIAGIFGMYELHNFTITEIFSDVFQAGSFSR